MSGAVVSATMKNRRKNNSQQQQTRSPQPLPPKRRKNQNQNANNEVNVADVLNEAHLLKIDNNQVYMLTKKEAAVKISKLIKDQQKMRTGYCNCLFFYIFVFLYLGVMNLQWNTVEMHEQYVSIRQDVLGPLLDANGYVADTIPNANFVVDDWLKPVLEPIFAKSKCGDAKCTGTGTDVSNQYLYIQWINK